MTQKEFLEIFRLLDYNYGKDTKPEIIRLWYDKFKNVSKDVFKQSIIDTIEWDNTFPTMHAVDERVEQNSKRVI